MSSVATASHMPEDSFESLRSVHHAKNLIPLPCFERIPEDAIPLYLEEGAHPLVRTLDSEYVIYDLRQSFKALLSSITSDKITHISLLTAFAEVVTNVYKHAYEEDAKGDAEIEIYHFKRPETEVLMFQVSDSGKGVSSLRHLIPFHSEKGFVDSSTGEGSLGGGLLIACSGVDEVHVRISKGKNVSEKGTSVRVLKVLSSTGNGNACLPEDLKASKISPRRIKTSSMEVPSSWLLQG